MYVAPLETDSDCHPLSVPLRHAPACMAIAVAALTTLVSLSDAHASDARASREADQPLCLYVSSYHTGYAWQDGVERGLRESLSGHCRIVQYDMDTKRRRAPDEIRLAAREALKLYQTLSPDVVITSDDNAAKHFIVPHLGDSSTPVVFSGINWTVEEYGFPTDGVTGIVEVAPIRPMMREAMNLVPNAKRAAYVGANTITEQKNVARLARTAERYGVELVSMLVDDLEAWKLAYNNAQSYDFIISGSSSGIDRWSTRKASWHAYTRLRRPCFTSHEWMMPVCAIGFTKLPEEHGELAGSTARAILDGVEVRDIPLITNRKWDTWLNVQLSGQMGVPVPERLASRAKKIEKFVDKAAVSDVLPTIGSAQPANTNAPVGSSMRSSASVTLGRDADKKAP